MTRQGNLLRCKLKHLPFLIRILHHCFIGMPCCVHKAAPVLPDLHRVPYTQEQLNTAAMIRHGLIKELANLSETGGFVPDSGLMIATKELSDAPIGRPFSV